MFLLPLLDARGLFDGPHTIRRRPRREVCADCGSPWTPNHQCGGWLAAAVGEPVVPLRRLPPPTDRQRVELARLERPALAPERRRP